MSVITLIKTELDRDNKTIDKILFYLEQHKTILNKTAILFLHKKLQLLHKCVLINEIILQQYEAGDLVECRWCGFSLLVSRFPITGCVTGQAQHEVRDLYLSLGLVLGCRLPRQTKGFLRKQRQPLWILSARVAPAARRSGTRGERGRSFEVWVLASHYDI